MVAGTPLKQLIKESRPLDMVKRLEGFYEDPVIRRRIEGTEVMPINKRLLKQQEELKQQEKEY